MDKDFDVAAEVISHGPSKRGIGQPKLRPYRGGFGANLYHTPRVDRLIRRDKG
jgi:hypothetical protein